MNALANDYLNRLYNRAMSEKDEACGRCDFEVAVSFRAIADFIRSEDRRLTQLLNDAMKIEYTCLGEDGWKELSKVKGASADGT